MDERWICPDCAAVLGARGSCPRDGATLEPVDADPLLGTPVGSYRLVKVIGTGATGAVYLGVHPQLKSRVAVKVLHFAASRDPDLIERFERAARAANRVRSHGVAKIFDLARTADGRPAALMEHVPGESLADRLAAAAPLDVAEAARVARSALRALETVHEAGVIHRDLKPANLQLTPRGHVVLLDFGVAKLTALAIAEARRTRTGALLGTPHYMSPEIARGGEVGPASDIYSMGAVLYECLVGEPPFAGTNLYELLHCHAAKEPEPASSRVAIDPLWDQLLARALAKQAEERFQSARAMRRAVEQMAG